VQPGNGRKTDRLHGRHDLTGALDLGTCFPQGRTLVGDCEVLVLPSKQEQRLLTVVLLELFKGESH
jgi:hypothetical protein